MAIKFPNDMRKSSNHVGISAFVLINPIFILIVKNSHASSGSSYFSCFLLVSTKGRKTGH